MGAVAADGRLTVTSAWKAVGVNPRYAFTATYSGTLSKGAGKLQGDQVWTFDGKTENRGCTIMITVQASSP